MTHAFDIKKGETSVFSSKNNCSFTMFLGWLIVGIKGLQGRISKLRCTSVPEWMDGWI